jgi:osmoprotectant transport system ATP-binding protein
MLKLENISKIYGNTAALHPTDLSLAEGKTTVLIGPSGCGKSTLLRLMINLIEPDSGRVLFNDATFSTQDTLELRRRMGYVIQDGGLFPHLTARENAAMVARWLGWTDDRVQSRTRELAQLTRFPVDGLDRYPTQLSGGQCQRVSLMRALFLDPEILLMDEPLSALDPMVRSDLQEDLKTIFLELRKTVVLVTHDIHEAWFFGDVIVLFRDGEIVQQGAMEELVNSPTDPFVTQFINAQRGISTGFE